MAVYTLDEIARLLAGFPSLATTKLTWPGATVMQVTRTIGDPLDGIVDSDVQLDDEIPF
jgi:hypothetical protein